ncbi:MAG: caspase family protein [Xenococcus sp. (in: cyanobacteria)]
MTKVALLIGVSDYKPGLSPLYAAVKDIEAMQRVLQDTEMGGFDEVKTLANPDPHTMQLEIETIFTERRTKNDLVLLFFSGHGIKDDSGRLYFATSETRKNIKGDLIRSTAVPASFVHDIMNNSPAKRQVIILDCCFSGAFAPYLLDKNGSPDLKTQLGAKGRAVLASSSSTQYSFEQQNSDLSLYTRYLVDGIKTGEADQNSDGYISILELHEYATSKVQETAPNITPKIIVLKDKGFEIVLAKTRVTNPKLKYRKTAARYAKAGKIRPVGRAILDTLRQKLELTVEEAKKIETEVLLPYKERLANLQRYRETLILETEHEYPLSEFTCEELNTLQQMLGLRDEDVLPIQQEIEAEFARKLVSYQQKLVQYEQALNHEIQLKFPLTLQSGNKLKNLQESLDLKDEDIASIEKPLLQQAKLRYQEQIMIQEAELQLPDEEEAELQQQEEERENYRRQYERAYFRAFQFVDQDKKRKIDGVDVISTIKISQKQAAAGCQLEIETIDGSVLLTIPPGIKSGTVLRLRGRGIPKLGNPVNRGNHLVTVNIK